MTLPYGFGSLSSGGSFPSLSSSGWPTPSASRSVPSTSSWSSDPFGSAAANYGQGIAAAANSGGNAWSLPSWSGSSGGASNPSSLSQFSQGSPLTGFFGSPAASGGGGTGSALSQFGQASPLSGFFGSGGNTAASNSGGFQPGGILGGAGQSSTPSWTSMFGGGGNTPSAGGAAGAAGGFQMPGGFGQGIFGVSPAAQSPTYTSGGSTPQAGNGQIASNKPAPVTTANAQQAKGKQYGDEKGAGTYKSLDEAMYNAGGYHVDPATGSYNKQHLAYGTNPDGTYFVSGDTPAPAKPAATAPKQTSAPPPVAIGGKIPAGGADTVAKNRQPTISTPTPAPSQPSAADVEKQRRDSGYYLG